ncbi:hypothetical protein Gotur_023401 [Gossypium turneri]
MLSNHELCMARIQAKDLFELKVEIIKLMAVLDPTGDWTGQGTRALDNLRTTTGEKSLERLHAFLDDLNQNGKGSETFLQLKRKRHSSLTLNSKMELFMEFSPRVAELTTLLESPITNFYTNFQVDEIGQVVSVGDNIARVYGLNEIQAGEMVEFASGVKGIALNVENENVGIFVFGSDTAIKEGDIVKRTGSIVDVPVGKAMLGHVVDALGVPIDGRGALSDHE